MLISQWILLYHNCLNIIIVIAFVLLSNINIMIVLSFFLIMAINKHIIINIFVLEVIRYWMFPKKWILICYSDRSSEDCYWMWHLITEAFDKIGNESIACGYKSFLSMEPELIIILVKKKRYTFADQERMPLLQFRSEIDNELYEKLAWGGGRKRTYRRRI